MKSGSFFVFFEVTLYSTFIAYVTEKGEISTRYNKIEIKMSKLKWHIKGKTPYCSSRECNTYVSATWIDKEEKQSKCFSIDS